jgi:RTX toxin transport system membrane fusion protein
MIKLRNRIIKNKNIKKTNNEFEFQPGYLEIIERPPAPIATITALSILSFVILCLIWSIFGELEIHATSKGKLLVTSNSKIVQSMESGQITSINVRDGKYVNKGDVLIRLNQVGIESEINEIEEKIEYRQIELSISKALLLEKSSNEIIMPFDIDENRKEFAMEQLDSRLGEYLSRLKEFDRKIEVSLANKKSIQQDIIYLEELLNNIEQRLSSRIVLQKSNLISRNEVLEKEKEKIDVNRILSQKKSEVNIVNAEIKSTKSGRITYLSTTKRNYMDIISKNKSEIKLLNQKLIKLRNKLDLQVITAPVSGYVQQLSVHTIGGVVKSAQELLVIVPHNQTLEAEVMILNKDVGFVQRGQKVQVKIDAFPYTRYGTLNGKVMFVSSDSVTHPELGLVFPARINLSTYHILVEQSKTPLQAGMSVTVEILTGKRRIIDYILSPLQEYQSEALRER